MKNQYFENIKEIKRDLSIKKFVRKINGIFMMKTGNTKWHKSLCQSCLDNSVLPEELKKFGAVCMDETIEYWEKNDYGKKAEKKEKENQKSKVQSGAVKRQKGLF